MKSPIPGVGWRGGAAIHAGLVGLAWAVTGFAGSSLVLAQSPGVRDATVMVATSVVAFCVGLWVGAGDVGREVLPIRDRWLAAAALTAVAGAFGTFSTLYRPLMLDAPWQVAGLILAVALPSYALGMLPPVLAAQVDRLLEEEESGGSTVAVAGTLSIGVLIGGVVGIVVSGLLALPFWSASSLLMVTALILLVPLAISPPAAPGTRESLIFEAVTPIGTWRVTEVKFPGERQPERRLYLEDEEESGELVRSGAPTLAYIVAAEQWLARTTPRAADYLLLGGGAYTLPRRIAERDRDARIVVVELDPETERIAHHYFGLRSHHHIRSVFGDARAFLEADGTGEFDRIYVDVYAGAEAVPYPLRTAEAASLMKRRLRSAGMVGVNLIGVTSGDEIRQVWSVVRTFERVFPEVALYTHLGPDYPDRQNLLLVAAADPGVSLPSSVGTFDLWPRGEWPDPPGTTVFHDLVSPPDTGGSDVRDRASVPAGNPGHGGEAD